MGCIVFAFEYSSLCFREGMRATGVAGLIAAALALPTAARAVQGCSGLADLTYLSGENFSIEGDVLRVQVSLGTGSITGGTNNDLSTHRFRFELDCQNISTIGCPSEGDIIRYVNDSTITSSGCGGVGWTTNGVDSAAGPNEVIFTPSAPVVLAANVPPSSGCIVAFDVRVETAPGTDSSPNVVQQAVGYNQATDDGTCDQPLPLSPAQFQPSQISLCPTCADGECFNEACDQDTGVCEHTNEPDSTTCTDTDNNACTTAGCDGQGVCSQSHVEVVCDDPECQECDPQTGTCIDRNPLPLTCQALLGCRVTAGGVAPDTENGPGGDALGQTSKATFGGQVGSPCGCIGCFDDLDSVQGQWTHSIKNQVGRFHASHFSSLVCDLDGGEGSLPRTAPANKVCFAGNGLLAENGGKRETPVAFRVDAEDRGEPGAGKNSGAQADVYRMRIWIPGPGQVPEDFLGGICCLNGEPVGVGVPDIDESDALTHGNIQIHPVLPNTVRGICPPPEEVEQCFRGVQGD